MAGMRNWICIGADGKTFTMRYEVQGSGVIFPSRAGHCSCYVGRFFRIVAPGVLREEYTDLMGLLERHERLEREEIESVGP